jgi:hypothetical protein
VAEVTDVVVTAVSPSSKVTIIGANVLNIGTDCSLSSATFSLAYIERGSTATIPVHYIYEALPRGLLEASLHFFNHQTVKVMVPLQRLSPVIVKSGDQETGSLK